MSVKVRSKVVRIGNSRGIRIPRTLLEQAGLSDEVELTVEGDRLIIHPVRSVRQGWEVKFAGMAEHGDDVKIDEAIASKWDDQEWEW